MQSNGGGEFLNNDFKDFLTYKGIVQYVPCSYTPQQNGLVEMKHRDIVETTLTLLSTTSLPHIFWYHAVFLINRMLSKILQMISPFEKLFHKKPDMSTLKVFGSVIYPYL